MCVGGEEGGVNRYVCRAINVCVCERGGGKECMCDGEVKGGVKMVSM